MALDTLAYIFCSRGDVEEVLSKFGVRTRLDDDNDGLVNTTEELRMTNARTLATETILFYLWGKYSPTQLSESNLVNLWTAYYAAVDVCRSRGNPVPEALANYIIDDIEPKLEDVAAGRRRLPGVARRRTQAPVWDNLRINLRNRFKNIRVERATSSTESMAKPVQVDYTAAYTYEI